MDFFDTRNYKKLVKNHIFSLPKKGYGAFKKMAEHLNVSTVFVSQVFNGEKHLSMDQAFLVTELFGFSKLQSKYFLLLVQIQRAGNHSYKSQLNKELSVIREEAKSIKNLVQVDGKLDVAAQGIFYSNWKYSAVRLLTSTKKFTMVDTISERLKISKSEVAEILDFLVRHGLCFKGAKGYEMGPRKLHLPADSPYELPRRTSWRLKGLENIKKPEDSQLFVSAPISMSLKDFASTQKLLLTTIDSIIKKVEKTEPEDLVCLNIDWFKV